MLFVGHKTTQRRILWARQQRNMVMMWQMEDKDPVEVVEAGGTSSGVVKNGGVTHDEKRARHFCDTCAPHAHATAQPATSTKRSSMIFLSKSFKNLKSQQLQ
jgi:hypothetical protein